MMPTKTKRTRQTCAEESGSAWSALVYAMNSAAAMRYTGAGVAGCVCRPFGLRLAASDGQSRCGTCARSFLVLLVQSGRRRQIKVAQVISAHNQAPRFEGLNLSHILPHICVPPPCFLRHLSLQRLEVLASSSLSPVVAVLAGRPLIRLVAIVSCIWHC